MSISLYKNPVFKSVYLRLEDHEAVFVLEHVADVAPLSLRTVAQGKTIVATAPDSILVEHIL